MTQRYRYGVQTKSQRFVMQYNRGSLAFLLWVNELNLLYIGSFTLAVDQLTIDIIFIVPEKEIKITCPESGQSRSASEGVWVTFMKLASRKDLKV